MKRYDIDFGCYEESSKIQKRSDAVVESTNGEWVEYTEVVAEIARLNHQHANDEAANRMLSDACARMQKEIAELRGVNTASPLPVEPEEVYSPHAIRIDDIGDTK